VILTDATVLIYNKPVDMRKAINGLSELASKELDKELTGGKIFVFWNRSKDKIKILYWHINGFCLLYKRLEKQKFNIPKVMPNHISVTSKELRWLLDGLDFNNLSGHKELGYEYFY